MRLIATHYQLHRLWAWFRKLNCCLRGRHTESDGDWGYAMKGLIDLYCPNCLQLVRRLPLDDFGDMNGVFAAMDAASNKPK